MRIALVAAAAVLALAAAEATLRVRRLVPDNVPLLYRAIDGDEAFAPRPGSGGTSVMGIAHRANSLGLRGPERPASKRPMVRRIVVVGDSVVWAHGVADGEGLVSRLERLLDRPDRPTETWNLGVPATNMFNHAARFARLGPLLQPDETVVMLLPNDLMAAPQRFRVTAGGSISRVGRASWFPDAWRPLLERLALYWLAARRFDPLLRGAPSVANPATKTEDYFPAMAGRLDAMADLAQSLGSGFMIALVPSLQVSAEQNSALERKLASYAESRRVRFIPLRATLGNPIRPEAVLAFDQWHPSPEGHRLMAEALAAVLR